MFPTPTPTFPLGDGQHPAFQPDVLHWATGYTRFRFHTSLAPHTTVRGAASLDWTKRPGNYAEVRACVRVRGRRQ